MAGAGYKLFNTGDVLTAAQVNTYLMEQTVMVFANATARTSALSGVLAEGMVSYLQDTNALEVYNGSAWVGAGSAGDIEGVTAGVGISGGGTSGTVTITNSMATAIDAKGDLIVGTGADTFSRLAVGTNGFGIVADSATATGLKYQATMGSYTSFTPVWTNLTVGNGTVTAFYREDVETVECLVDLTFGSTTSVTGNIQFDLPVTASSRRMYQPGGFLLDSGAYTINCWVFITTTTKGEIAWINVNEGATGQNFGVTDTANATKPWTWTTNDRICAFFTYEK